MATASQSTSPFAAGSVLAMLAAIAFGLTAPIISKAGREVGSFTTASLLYGGAFASSVVFRAFSRASGPRLGRAQLPRVLLVALSGAAIAPVCLAWGLQRVGATTGALLLNLESVFTVLLARAVFREPFGRRVAVALGLMVAGGVLLGAGAGANVGFTTLGSLAIAAATLAWATDNTLSRKLADFDAWEVVAAKAALGALATFSMSRILGERGPTAFAALALLACGASGYGLSLRLYLLAQRRIGAARTGSVFAVGPFVGAAFAWLLGDRHSDVWTLASAALFGLGVYLHATEQHRHRHRHPPMAHEHAHRHDDGHHDHVHDPPPRGEHSHAHTHVGTEHEHEHGPDLHHDHVHTR